MLGESAFEHSFSTASLPASQQIRHWQNSTMPMFDDASFRCDVESGQGLDARVEFAVHGDIKLFQLQAGAHRVRRRLNQRSRPAILITWQVEGVCRLRYDGKHTVLTPGDFAVLYTNKKFDLQFDSLVRQFVMRVPVSMLCDPLNINERLSGRGLSSRGGAGYIAGRFLHSFVRELPKLHETQSQRIFRSLMDLIKTASFVSEVGDGFRHSSYVESMVTRIRSYVDDHLHEDDLSPGQIASAQGISVRHMNKLFEKEGCSVNKLIWRSRLHRCRADLINRSMASLSITEIAFAWGFKSASHFSRSFKEEFGCSPTAVRATLPNRDPLNPDWKELQRNAQ